MKNYKVKLYDIDRHIVDTIRITAKDYEQAERKVISIANSLQIIYSYSIK